MDLKDKHIPNKWVVKFNKKKHTKNEWATSALLKSINVKNKMYTKLQQRNIHDAYYNTTKQKYITYRIILRKSIVDAKQNYFHDYFNLYKGNLKPSWSLINKNIKSTKQNC